MKKLLALVTALVLITAPLAYAGPKGGGGRSSFGSGNMPKSFTQPGQPQTGTIKDLGVNPSSKSPIDSVKNKSTTPSTAATPAPSAAGPAQPAPAAGFFGGGGFGSGWLNWAILGYLFGRHTGRPDEARIKEKEQVKQKDQAAGKEQAKDSSDSNAKEQVNDQKPSTQSKSPLELK